MNHLLSGVVDSHAHLADVAFDSDRDDVVDRARGAGVESIVCVGESLAAAVRARELAARFPRFVYWTAGVHPHDAGRFDAATDVPILRRALDSGAVAVGECGLDYHYDHAPHDVQRTAFACQLALAAETGFPVIVHCREADDDTHQMMTDAGSRGVRGVLHCFTGSHALARAALETGWYISFSGLITFRSWTDDELIRLVPDDRLLVESDAPYLAPVPHRGRRNEPMWVARTIERLASARAADVVALVRATAANARRLFGLATAP